MIVFTKIFVLLITTTLLICSRSTAEDNQESCETQLTCGDCIRTPSCAWCMQPEFHTKRCFSLINSTTITDCLEEFTFHPEPESRITLNRAFLSNTNESVHISPQRMSLKLRTNQRYQIPIRYLTIDESSVTIKDNATSLVAIKYYSSCLSENVLSLTNRCDDLKANDAVNFIAEIEVLRCPDELSNSRESFHIFPVGISESLVVDLETFCSCPCEHESHPFFEEKSKNCNFVGTNKCGICDCDEGNFGKHCECTGIYSENQCRPNNHTFVDCSGRGNCVCGVCECELRPNPEEYIFGKFCECDNFSCARANGFICSGPDHGRCECGKCLCTPNWTGSACECSTTSENCISPK